MAERFTRQIVAEQAIIHEEPTLRVPHAVDRTYVGTAAGYLGFMALMVAGFGNPKLILPVAIIVVFIAMFFGVNALWMRMKPATSKGLTSWGRFQREGVMTAYGRCTAGAATVQVLILPVLILLWGLAVVTIAAAVR
jgi:hypothetical protein